MPDAPPRVFMKARVLFHNPSFNFGGAERVLSVILENLNRKSFEPTLCTEGSGGELKAWARARGIAHLTYRSGKGAQHALVGILRKQRFDLVDASHYSPLPALAASEAGVPFVWRSGSHIDVVCADQPREDRRDFLKKMVALSARVVSLSRFIDSQFRSLGVRTEVILPGIDCDGIRAEAGARAFPRLAAYRVGMIGHLHPQKRHEDFLRAAKIALRTSPHLEFWLMGACYPNAESRAYRRSLIALTRRLGIEKKVRFLQEFRRPFEVIAQMDTVVLPSIGEGAGLALLEAMALEKPVVAARSGGIPELVVHGKTGWLVPPRSPAAIAARITRLAADEPLARAVGKRARLHVKKKFRGKRMTAQLERVYRDAIKGR